LQHKWIPTIPTHL